MSESLREFFKRLMKDEEFREEFASAKTAYEGYTMAKPYIEGISFEEFKEALTTIHNKVSYRKELLNQDLESISGGSTNIFTEVLFMLANLEDGLF